MIKPNKLSHAIMAMTASLSSAGAITQTQGAIGEAVEEEEVIVQGIRSSLIKANDLKKNSSSIQDSIVAEDIGKFPDQNVAESLQRITGVSISRSNGEGSEVTVRGFGPEFNVVRVNDRALATTDAGRSFDFQVLPSGLITGADIIKAPRANLEAGSVGGYVNIRTARPLDNPGLKLASSVDLNYNELSEDTNPSFSASFSNTFSDDTVGIALGFAYREIDSRIDKYRTNRWHELFAPPANLDVDSDSATPGAIQIQGGGTAEGFRRPGRAAFEVHEEDRSRLGVNGVFQWSPNENWTTTIDALYAELDRSVFAQGIQIPTQATFYNDVVVDNDLTVVSHTITRNNIDGLYRELGQDSETYAFGFNQVYNKDKLTVELDIARSKATSNPILNEFVPHFNLNAPGPNPDVEGGEIDPRLITLDYGQGDVLNATSTIDVTDINQIRTHWNGLQNWENEDDVTEIKLKGKFEFDEGVISSIEGGISRLDREKSRDHFSGVVDGSIGCSPCGGTVAFTDNPGAIFSAGNLDGFLSEESGTFLRDWLFLNNLDEYKRQLIDIRAAQGIEGNPFLTPLNRPGSFVNEEETTSLYTQLNFDGGGDASYNWSGNIGVRYVTTDRRSSGFGEEVTGVELNENSSDSELRLDVIRSAPTNLQVSNSDSHLLPSANLSLDFNNGYYFKAGVATTITQPAIEDTGVNQNIVANDTGRLIQTGSNPLLEPYKVNQLDLSLEHYFDNDSSVSVAFFYKDITSFISTTSTIEDFDGDVAPEVLESSALAGDTVQIERATKQNRSGGTVSGLEFGVLHYFDYLPGFFSGFGVQANYTYADSVDSGAEPFIQPGIQDVGSVLEGFAKNSYNLIGFYDRDGLQLRLAYNWRGDFLRSRDGAEADIATGLPVHTADYGQLDASFSYDITDNFTVFVEGINLTDEKRVDYVDIRSRVTEVEYFGSRYQFGIRASW